MMNFFELPIAIAVLALGIMIGVLISVAWVLAPFQAPYKLRPAHAVVEVPR